MQKNIFIIVSILAAGMLIYFASSSGQRPYTTSQNSGSDTKVETVQIVDGKQIIEINARGGYRPNSVTAKAGIPTILRMKTSGTFDCSASFVIPSLGIQKILPQTGTTDFEIPVQKTGSSIRGTCGMGMYSLVLNFE